MRRSFTCLGLILVVSVVVSASEEPVSPKHLTDARALVKNLKSENTGYEHKKREQFVWDGDPVAYCDCSGLLNNLLMHSYGYSKADLQKWFGVARPKAEHYYDLVVATPRKGFQQIQRLKDVRPGDLLVVKYAELSSDRSTGHVMLVDAAPVEMQPTAPEVDGAVKQWSVSIIDSSRSGHGKTDTRNANGEKNGGVGRGLLRLYTDARGEVIAYTWSPESRRTVYPRDTHPLVIGRLTPKFKP